MMLMKTLLVATDFSERSDRALRRASLLARASGAALTLVHVLDEDQPSFYLERMESEASALLERTAASLGESDGLTCDAQVIVADPIVGIRTLVEDRQPDMLIIGPHRRQTLRDLFVGTTAERIIRCVPCPVLMANGSPSGPYRHVLVSADLSPGSNDALRQFGALGLRGSELTSIRHVLSLPELRLSMAPAPSAAAQQAQIDAAKATAEVALATLLRDTDMADLAVQVIEDGAVPANALQRLAASEAADLLVMATHGRKGESRYRLGSVTENVLRHSTIDVLVIPPRVA
ncbi:MAG: universal stress protein [Oceanococcaceae bacterium]